VSLAGNEIGDEGAQRLMEVLKVNQTIYDMDLGGNPLGGGLQQELDDHTSSRVTFGTPSSDRYEKCLSASQCHAGFSFPLREDSGGKGSQRPALSRKPEVDASNADEYFGKDQSKNFDADEGETSDPDDGDHMSATELDDATDIDSNLSDQTINIPRESQRPTIQNSIRGHVAELIL